jgi:hypothetical protein
MIFPREIMRVILSFVDPYTLNNYELTYKSNYTDQQEIWKKFLFDDLREMKYKLKILPVDYKKTYRMLMVPIRKLSIYFGYSTPKDSLKNILSKSFPQNKYDWFKMIYASTTHSNITSTENIDIRSWIKNQRRKIFCEKKCDRIKFYKGMMNDDFVKCFHEESDLYEQTIELIEKHLISN